MRVVAEIPREILELLSGNEGIGRRELSRLANISENDARYYLKLWKDKLGDSSPKTLGMNQILSEQVKSQHKSIKSLERQIATESVLIEKIGEMIPEFVTPLSIPKPKTRTGEKIDVRDVITIWSDFHAGEVVDLEQTEGKNEYNMDIMAGRLWNLIRGIIRITDSQRDKFQIETLHIDILGDIVGGNIHDELKETNEFPILRTVLETANLMAQAIAMLVPHFEKIKIFGLPGNHGRLSIKPEFKNKVINNYDTLVYHIMKLHLRNYIDNKNIEFIIPESPECLTVRRGWSFLLGHSDHVRAWAGFPVYGFFRDNAKQQQLRKVRSVLSENEIIPAEDLEGAIINFRNAKSVSGFDYRECGHWHTLLVLDDWSTIINGSLIGGNEYSLHKLHAMSKPVQTIMFLSEKWGIKGIEPLHCLDKGHEFRLYKQEI